MFDLFAVLKAPTTVSRRRAHTQTCISRISSGDKKAGVCKEGRGGGGEVCVCVCAWARLCARVSECTCTHACPRTLARRAHPLCFVNVIVQRALDTDMTERAQRVWTVRHRHD